MRQRHIHKYIRKSMKFQDIWMCALGCGHYIPKNVEEMIETSQSLCWVCGKQFQINQDAIETCLKEKEGMEQSVMKCFDCRFRELLAREIQNDAK